MTIIWPTIALVALIFIIWFALFVQRLGHVRHNPPSAADFATREAAGRYFQPVENTSGNLINLFEMPVLFFALVPLLLLTGLDSFAQFVLAWAFVALRAAHSYVQIAVRRIPVRFGIYLASCAVLLAMWIGFAIDMVSQVEPM